MNMVELTIKPVLACVLTNHKSGPLILKKEIRKGATICDLLADIAPDYHNFRYIVFDPDTRLINDDVTIILNDRLLQLEDVMEARLNNGDRIMLNIVFSGG